MRSNPYIATRVRLMIIGTNLLGTKEAHSLRRDSDLSGGGYLIYTPCTRNEGRIEQILTLSLRRANM